MKSLLLMYGLEFGLALSLPWTSQPPPDALTPDRVQGVPDGPEAPADASAYTGETVVVTGVVTTPDLPMRMLEEDAAGFSIQTDRDPGDVSDASQGLLVWLSPDADAPDLQRGETVRVRGTVREIHENTCLVDSRILERGGAAAGEVPTVSVAPPSERAEAAAYWEALEGMRVRIEAGAVVQGARKMENGDPAGPLYLVAASHPILDRENPAARRVFRDAHPLDDNPDTLFDNGNGFFIRLRTPRTIDTDGESHAPRTFDELVESIEGVVVERYGRPVVYAGADAVLTPGHDPAATRPALPKIGGPRLTVVSYNVENLYDHRDDPFDRDDYEAEWDDEGNPILRDYVPGSEDAYRRKLDGIADHIVRELDSPDLLLLQELEDQDIGSMEEDGLVIGPFDNRDGQLDILQELIPAIEKAGGPAYAIRANRAAADYRGIMCAFLYRPDRLAPAKPAADHPVLGTRLQFDYEGRLMSAAPYPHMPRVIDSLHPRRGNVFNRPPVLGLFRLVEYPDTPPILAINNHFKSRPDAAVARRREQARVNALLTSAVLEDNPDALVVVGGDLNVYPRPHDPFPEDPSDQLASLYDAGLVNVYDHMLSRYPEGAYSYVYQGQAQTLDQIFLSPALAEQLIHAENIHLNSDFTPGEEDRDRAWSDHDPLRILLRLPAE